MAGVRDTLLPSEDTVTDDLPDTLAPVEPAGEPTLPEASILRDAAAAAKARARALDQLAAAGDDPAALRRARAALEKAPWQDCADLVGRVDDWLTHEQATRRSRLARALRDLCRDAGLELVVITRDPLELRIAPVGLRVDVDRDRVDVVFGQQVLQTCAAQADAVMHARQQVLDDLDGGPWDPAAFHAALRAAWQQLSGETWVELADLLPQLALALQDDRFRRDPCARNFRPYPRARLAWDLWRLRRDRVLSVDGWRLTLGPATGGSTRDKKRVFWLEDDQGRGQYYLTLRFQRDTERLDA